MNAEKLLINSDMMPGNRHFETPGGSEMTALLSCGEVRTYTSGSRLFAEGASAEGVHFVDSGLAKVYRRGRNEDECIISLVKKGEFLGLPAVMQKGVHISSASAIQPLEALFLDRKTFREFLDAHAAVQFQFIRLMCREIESIETQIVCLAHKSARQRAALTLLMLDDVLAPENAGVLPLTLELEELANLAKIARGTLYKLLRELQAEKRIEMNASGIHLLDTDYLNEIAGA